MALVGCDSDEKAAGTAADGKPAPAGAATSGAGTGSGSGPVGLATAKPFTGPAVPGLAGKPSWSVGFSADPPGPSEPVVVALGSTVVVATPVPSPSVPYEYGVSDHAVRFHRVEFRDAATGTVRKSLQLYGEVSAETWSGKPAIVVRGRTVVPSDGLSAEKRAWVVEAYDEQATRLGGTELPALGQAGGRDVRVVDGWVVEVAGLPGNTTVVRAADRPGTEVRLTCLNSQCGPRPLVAGTVMIQEIAGRQTLSPGRLAAFDPVTGARRWDTDTVERPVGSDPAAYSTGQLPHLLGAFDGKVLIGWSTKQFGMGEVLGLHDPVTGKLLATGPTIAEGVSSWFTDPTGKLAVVSDGDHVAVWEAGTFRTLWQQASDEAKIATDAVVGGVLYVNGGKPDRNDGDVRTMMAIDVRTKQILARNLPNAGIEPIGAGYALYRVPWAIHIFRVENRPAQS
ncbi:hypothetical protein OG216_44760 [Streptomycetaceae bacterium NBC_01309]